MVTRSREEPRPPGRSVMASSYPRRRRMQTERAGRRLIADPLGGPLGAKAGANGPRLAAPNPPLRMSTSAARQKPLCPPCSRSPPGGRERRVTESAQADAVQEDADAYAVVDVGRSNNAATIEMTRPSGCPEGLAGWRRGESNPGPESFSDGVYVRSRSMVAGR